jgi:hypothetical protein
VGAYSLQEPEEYRPRPLKSGLILSAALFFVYPWAGAFGLFFTVLFGLAFAARRHSLAIDEAGLMTTRFGGLLRRYVPYPQIERLEIEGQELVARDQRGKVLCRHFELETARLVEAFSSVDAAMAQHDASATGFERDGRGLHEWLASIDARIAAASAGPYRGQPLDWEQVLGVFRSPSRSAEARAGAAWALLGSRDPMHHAVVVGAIGPELPPLVLALCALRTSQPTAMLLTKQRRAFLTRSDRRALRRLLRQRRFRIESSPRVRVAPAEASPDARDAAEDDRAVTHGASGQLSPTRASR